MAETSDGNGTASPDVPRVKDAPLSQTDPELDELLDEAAKGFDVHPPVSAQHPPAPRPPPSPATDDLEKLLGGEAGELGDLLADQFQKVFQQSLESAVDDGAGDSGGAAGDVFARTMEELSRNMHQLGAGMKPGQAPPDNLFAELFKGMAAEGAGGEGEPDLSSASFAGNLDQLVQDFISTLLDKEVLYPSLRELSDKFPDWLAANQSQHEPPQHERFAAQAKLVARMCAEYESQGAAAAGGETGPGIGGGSMDRLVGLMQQMRELGNSPDDLMKQVQGDPGALDPSQCPVM